MPKTTVFVGPPLKQKYVLKYQSLLKQAIAYILALFADNELYSGTVADFSGSDPIIYREPLQTEQYDSLSLNGKFLGAFVATCGN